MPPLSDKERARRYRYAHQLERAAHKLMRLVQAPPEGMSANSIEHSDTLVTVMDCLVGLMGADGNEWVKGEDRDGMLFFHKKDENDFPLIKSPLEKVITCVDESLEGMDWAGMPDDTLVGLHPDYVSYLTYKERAKSNRSALKISKMKFCREVLTAQMTNPRSGWVGSRMPDAEHEGSIFVFSWEHLLNNLDSEGLEVDIFPSEVGLSESGRKSAGYRDALEKIKLGIENHFTFYIVWQKATNESDEVLIGKSINGEFLTRFEPILTDTNVWRARLIDHIKIK